MLRGQDEGVHGEGLHCCGDHQGVPRRQRNGRPRHRTVLQVGHQLRDPKRGGGKERGQEQRGRGREGEQEEERQRETGGEQVELNWGQVEAEIRINHCGPRRQHLSQRSQGPSSLASWAHTNHTSSTSLNFPNIRNMLSILSILTPSTWLLLYAQRSHSR